MLVRSAYLKLVMLPYLSDVNNVQPSLKLHKRAVCGYDIPLDEMRLEFVAILEHVKAQIPEIDNVEPVQVLAGSAVAHQVAQIMANETADVC